MAAGDFTAATYPNVLVALADVQSTRHLDMEMDAPVRPLETLARRQTLTLTDMEGEILTGGRCTTVKAHHTVVGSHLLVHERAEADPAQGCDLVTGQRLQSIPKDYTKNYNIKSAFQVNDNECGNASEFSVKVATGMQRVMAENRRRLQATNLYGLLDSNAQLNEANAAILPEFLDQGTGNKLKVAPGLWNFELALKLRMLGQQNRLGNFIAIGGSNLYFDEKVAAYRGQNDNQRDQNAIFSDLEMAWDTYDLDIAIGTPATYLVSTDVMAIWNSAWWSNTPELIDPSTNYYRFKVADPVLRWNNNGTLIPFYHHFEHKFVCVSRDSSDETKYAHTFNGTLIGGMHKAPDGFNWPYDTATAPTQTRTGIMAIYNEA